MPIDPQYADVGMDFYNKLETTRAIGAQVGFDFSIMEDGTFTSSNGVRSTDPSDIIDLSGFGPYAPIEVTNGRFGNSSTSSEMVFITDGVVVAPTGAYFRSELIHSANLNVTFGMFHPLGEAGGYAAQVSVINGSLNLELKRVTAASATEESLKSVKLAQPSNGSSNAFIFSWDGQKFQAQFNDTIITAIDTTYPLVDLGGGYILGIINGANCNCIKKLDLGQFDGKNLPNLSGDPYYDPINSTAKLNALSGPERGLSFISHVATSEMIDVGTSLTPGTELIEMADVCKSFSTGQLLSLDGVPASLAEIQPFPGDLYQVPNKLRVGFIDPASDEIINVEDLATNNFGWRGHIITPIVPATPLFPEDDFADIASIASDDIASGRIPFFNFLYFDWQGGATPSFDSDFQFIIDELSTVDGPCYVSIAGNPKQFYDVAGTFDDWLTLQSYFKQILTDSGNNNISFVLATPFDNYFSGDAVFIDAISSLEEKLWDIFILDITYSNLTFWQPNLENVRAWAKSNRMKMLITFKNATISSEQALHNIDLYEYCLSSDSDDSLLARILGLAYLNISDEVTSETPLIPPYTYSDISLPTGTYESFSVDLTPELDPATDDYFWACQFEFASGDTGYIGLQTSLAASLTGKGAIFGVSNGISGEVGPGGLTGVVDSDFSGGTGITVRVQYSWTANHTYRLTLGRGSDDGSGRLWTATVEDLTASTTYDFGIIKVPSGWGAITDAAVVWTEHYAPDIFSCSAIEHSSVKWQNVSAIPLGGGSPETTSGWVNRYETGSTCVNANISSISGGVRQEMGIVGGSGLIGGPVLDGFVELIDRAESASSDVGTQTRYSGPATLFPSADNYDKVAEFFINCLSQIQASSISPWNRLTNINLPLDQNYLKYEEMYTYVANSLRQTTPAITLYGPDIECGPTGQGFDSTVNGVAVDSRATDALENFINGAEAATPLYPLDVVLVTGDGGWSVEDYGNFIDYLKSLTNLPIAIRLYGDFDNQFASDVLQLLDPVDKLILTHRFYFNLDNLTLTSSGWEFASTLSLPSPGALDAVLRFTYSEDILANGIVYIEGDSYSEQFDLSKSGLGIRIGNLEPDTYTIRVLGTVLKSGSATLRLSFNADNIDEKVISDTKSFEVM
ncbi:MAG: hypothetical protein EBU08_00295 [Micrococcales bacterium]|nr:hypothetical protein [Micrococcales bacterium]